MNRKIASLAVLMFFSASAWAQQINGNPNGLKPTQIPLGTGYNVGQAFSVGNGSSATDCTTGGGTTAVVCLWNGSSWAAIGSGLAMPLTFTGASTVPNGASIYFGPTTAGGAVASGGIEYFSGTYQATSGPTYGLDYWSLQNVVGAGTNGTSTLTLSHSGTSGTLSLATPTMTAPSLSIGGNAATATNLASYPALCTGSNYSQGLSSGSNNCAAVTSGGSPTVITTGSACTIGTTSAGCPFTAATSGNVFNQESTPGTAIVYTLPTAAASVTWCASNSYNGSAPTTGTLELLTSTSGQYIIYSDGSLSASGGYVISSGVAGDSACLVGVDTAHWQFYSVRGAWAKF